MNDIDGGSGAEPVGAGLQRNGKAARTPHE